jgi:hypothetical protein
MFFDPDGLLARRTSKMESQLRESQMTDSFPYPDWQKPCQEALVELDQVKLRERITVAEAAIVSRLQTMPARPLNPVERRAIDDALAALRVLKRECVDASRQDESG